MPEDDLSLLATKETSTQKALKRVAAFWQLSGGSSEFLVRPVLFLMFQGDSLKLGLVVFDVSG